MPFLTMSDSRRQRTSLILVATTAFLGLTSCGPNEPVKNEMPPPEVLVMTVKGQDVPVISSWLGTLNGSSNASIKARVQGYLTKINYDAGKVVKTGDVLFEIDPRPFEAALDQAKANLAQAQANQEKAAQEAKRQENLFAQKAASERDRDIAVQNNEAAKAAVLAQEAAVENAKINLAYTKVTAPIDGIVGIANPGIGDLIGPSSGELAGLSTVNPIKAVFQISENEYYQNAKALSEGLSKPIEARKQNIELVLADGSVYPKKGRFLSADRQINEKTGTLQIEAIVENPDNSLRPGFFVRVQVHSETIENGILIPQQAVIQTQGLCSVAVVKGNTVTIQRVKATRQIGSKWLIEEGLKVGDTIVVEGIQKIRDGAPVTPKPFEPSPTASTSGTN